MTTAPPGPRLHRISAVEAAGLTRRLLDGFPGVPAPDPQMANQQMLDALDKGEHARFVVWPRREPLGVLYSAPNGTVVAAGRAEAGQMLSDAMVATGWRVLIGDAPICRAILDASFSGLLRRRVRQREQRLMVGERVADWPGRVPEGFRPAGRGDLEALTELAARLHVEDQMGPPLSRAGRAAVRSRMLESLAHDATWVVERDGEVVAKVDVSLHSRIRGAQIAGVYVLPRWRGRGVGGGAVAALSQELLGSGLPGVTLHVRSDNAAAITAYRRAGFVDHGAWILALR